MFGLGIFRKQKIVAPKIASGTEPRMMMNGSRKLLNQKFQRGFQRHDGDAAELDGVQLLEPVQRARRRVFFQPREGADGNELRARPLDVGVLQLLGVHPRAAFELRNDLVAAAGEVEAVHIIAADERAQIRTDGLHVEAERGDFVAVNDQLDFRLVHLRVNHRREGEHAVGRAFLLQLLGVFQNFLRLAGAGQHEVHRKIFPAGRQRRRRDHEHTNARQPVHHRLHLRRNLENSALALAPRLEHQAAETAVRLGQLKHLFLLRHLGK